VVVVVIMMMMMMMMNLYASPNIIRVIESQWSEDFLLAIHMKIMLVQ
jgi:hypothetical protein